MCDCKNRNYTTTKNKKKHSERLETKKFCKHLPQADRSQRSEVTTDEVVILSEGAPSFARRVEDLDVWCGASYRRSCTRFWS